MTKYMKKRAWEVQKILIFVHLALCPLIAGIILNTRDWSTLLPSRVCSCCVDIMGMLILLDLFFICVKDRNDLTLRTGYFTYLISMNSIALFADLICWSLDGLPEYRVVTWIANETPHAEPTSLIANVKREVEEFTKGAEQFDDMTMLAFRMKEPGNATTGKDL